MFSKWPPNFSLHQWKRSKTRVAEEYCWVITQTVKRSCCGRTYYSVRSLDFNWTALCIYTEWSFMQSTALCTHAQWSFKATALCIHTEWSFMHRLLSTDLRKIRPEPDLPERTCVCTSFRVVQFTHLLPNPVTQSEVSPTCLMCL